MKNIVYIFLCAVLLCACTQSGKVKTKSESAKMEYPGLFMEHKVPMVTSGELFPGTADSKKLREEVVIIQTPDSFRDLANFYLKEFKKDGWKIIKRQHMRKGEPDELFILSQSKGKLKHVVIIQNTYDNRRNVKVRLTSL